MLRGTVLSVCIMGLISCIAGSLSAGSGRSMIKLMVNMALIITLLRPFTGISGEDTLNLSEGAGLTDESLLREEPEDYSLRAAELSIQIELEGLLEREGINAEDTVITCVKDEYDVISVGSAEVTVTTAEDAEKLRVLAAERFPELPLTVRTAD